MLVWQQEGHLGIWPVKTEWWGAGMVICLGQGADLHMAQLMPLLLKMAVCVLCSSNSIAVTCQNY